MLIFVAADFELTNAIPKFDVALDFLLKFLLIVIGIMAVVHEFLPNELILLFYLF